MPFVRTVHNPKQSYNQSDHDWAETLLARRVKVEPRCNVSSTACLQVLDKGYFAQYHGTGPDAGKGLHASFINKGSASLRLIYFAPDGSESNADCLKMLSKAVKDAFQGAIDSVYWLVKDDDPASIDKAVMSGLAAQVASDWPSLHIATTTPQGFTRWEVSQ